MLLPYSFAPHLGYARRLCRRTPAGQNILLQVACAVAQALGRAHCQRRSLLRSQFAAKEDFGIMCVEAQACGTPVLALDYGGYRETVIDGQTGYLFATQTEQSVADAVRQMEREPLTNHAAIRQNALRFSAQRFRKEL